MAELATKADLLAMEQKLQKELRNMTMKLRLQTGLHDVFELQTLRLTARFGVMMVIWVVAVVIIVKLT